MRGLFLAVLLFIVSVCLAQTKVPKILVEGAKQVSRESIMAVLPLKEGDEMSPENLAAAQQAVERMGFFKSVRFVKQPESLVLYVEEWPVVERVEVTGNAAIPTKDILGVLQLETGRIFNSITLLAGVQKVQDLYKKRSYFGDVVSADFKTDEPNVLKVEIMEMTVNSVTPYGNKRTKSGIIERLLYTKPGMPYNKDKWMSDIRRLQATNWFEDVTVFSRESSPGKIDLVPSVIEAKTGEWTAGLSTEPGGPVVGTFSISERNLRGTGQSIRFNGAQGLQTQGPSLGVDYGNPFFWRENISLAVSLYTRASYRFAGLGLGNGEDPSGAQTFSERRTGAMIGLAKNLDSNTSAEVGVRVEDVRSTDSPPATGITRQNGALASLIFGVTRNRRDTDIDPSRGDWWRLGVEPGITRITSSGGSLTGAAGIGNHAFVKTTAEYRTYWSLDPVRELEDLEKPSRVFALRVRFGSIYGDAPFSEQFFVGGTDSVRGYAQDRYWGSQMFISTLEYRHPLSRDFGLIGFVDYGGAWGGYGGLNDFTQSRGVNLNLGYGLGLHYRVPKLGPVRIDLGFDRYGKARTHFQIAWPF